MKKMITIIMLSSVFLIPNHSAEAAYTSEESNNFNIEVRQYGGWYNNYYNHHIKNQRFSSNWNKKFYQCQYFYQQPSWENKETVEKPNPNKEEQLAEKNESTIVDEHKNSVNDSASILSVFEQEVLNLTNDERRKQGLQPLQIDHNLTKAAQEKSKDMSRSQYFSHTSPTYGSPFDMMKKYGVTYRSAAENIARGQRTAEEVVNAWMNSPGHRQNILTPNFTHIGIGHEPSGNYWTQQFIQK